MCVYIYISDMVLIFCFFFGGDDGTSNALPVSDMVLKDMGRKSGPSQANVGPVFGWRAVSGAPETTYTEGSCILIPKP